MKKSIKEASDVKIDFYYKRKNTDDNVSKMKVTSCIYIYTHMAFIIFFLVFTVLLYYMKQRSQKMTF